jgi:hypothetical protein
VTTTFNAPGSGPQPGGAQELTLWAYSDECTKVVRSELKRALLPTNDVMVDDLAAAVTNNILRHVDRNPEQTYRNVPGYGRRVTRFTLTRLSSGKELVDIDDLELPEPAPEPHGNELLDSARVYIEQAGGPVWLMAAALAYLTMAAYEQVRPEQAPWPKAGAKPKVALGWPALWLAGVCDVFPSDGKDGKRRRRNQWVARVVERVESSTRLAVRREV